MSISAQFEELDRSIARIKAEFTGVELNRSTKRQMIKELHRDFKKDFGIREITDRWNDLDDEARRSLLNTNQGLNSIARGIITYERVISECSSPVLIQGRYQVGEGVHEQILQTGGIITTERLSATPVLPSRYYEDDETGKILIELTCKVRGKLKRVTIPLSQIAIVTEIIKLSDIGLDITSVNAKRMIEFLAAARVEFENEIPYSHLTSKNGWIKFNDKFYYGLGSNIFPENNEIEKNVSEEDQQLASFIKKEGSREEWVLAINWILKFPIARIYVGLLLSAPLLSHLGCPNFIVHLFGNSTVGKSTLLMAYLSFLGLPTDSGLRLGWNVTRNGPEARARQFQDLGAPFDDSSQLEVDLINEVIYLLANGKGKQRAGKTGKALPGANFNTVVGSNGEGPLRTSTSRTGTTVRVIDIALSPFFGSKVSVDEIETFSKVISENYGFGFPEYIQEILKLVNNEKSLIELKEEYEAIKSQLSSKSENKYLLRMVPYFSIGYLALRVLGYSIPELSVDEDKTMEAVLLVIKDQEERLSEQNDVDARALKYVIEFFIRFNKSGVVESNHEVWGKVVKRNDKRTSPGMAIIATKLEQILKEGGFDVQACLRFFRDKGWIWQKNGQLWSVNFNGRYIRAYVFDTEKAKEIGALCEE